MKPGLFLLLVNLTQTLTASGADTIGINVSHCVPIWLIGLFFFIPLLKWISSLSLKVTIQISVNIKNGVTNDAIEK